MIWQIIFEFKKHFFKRSIIWAIVVFLAVDAFLIDSLHREKAVFSIVPEFQAAYDILYETYGGFITAEKIKNLLALYRPIQKNVSNHIADTSYNPDSLTYNQYSDELFLRWCFVEPLEYAFKYQQIAAKIVQRALDNLELYQNTGNEYACRVNRRIAEMFAGRQISRFYYTEMYQYYLQHDVSLFFVLLIITAALTNVFVLEKETGMELLLITTVHGNRHAVLAKLAASFLFIAGICALFWMADLLLFGFFFGGFEGGSNPVYAVEYFEYSSINCSLLQYSFISMGVKTTGVLVIGLQVLLLSSLCKNALLPFAGSLLTVGGCASAFSAALPVCLDGVLLWNPVCLLVNRELFYRTAFLSIGGWPVLTWHAALLAAGLLTVLLSVAVLHGECRKEYIYARRNLV